MFDSYFCSLNLIFFVFFTTKREKKNVLSMFSLFFRSKIVFKNDKQIGPFFFNFYMFINLVVYMQFMGVI